MGAFSTSNPTSGSDVTGTGTTGQIAVWASAQVIGNPVVNFTSRPTGFVIGSTAEEVAGILTLTSTTQGFIIPRMTTAQSNAIASPVAGLMVFNSTTDTIRLYTSAGWQSVITNTVLPATYVIGDLLYANSTSTLARLADVDTGNVLMSGGVGVAPAWTAAPSFGTSMTSPIVYTPSIISSASPAAGITIVSTTTGTVSIDSGTTGAINIGTGANAKSINIGNSTAGTGLVLVCGTGNGSITTNNGNFSIISGTGSILVGTDAADHAITIGTSTGVSLVSVNAGTGGVNIGTNAIAHTVTIGNITSTTAVNINSGSANSTWTTTNGAWSLVTGTGTISIGTDAADHTINIGNSTGTTPININSGTSGVNIGTNAIAHTVTIGNVTGATAVNINCGTGTSTWTTTNGVWTLATGTGTVSISADATVNAINIGTGGAAKTIKFGSASGTLLGFFGATAIVQITTGVAAATFVANTSGILNDTATWDSYTAGQVVKALRNYGLLT